jgi:GTP-binding protein
MSMHNLVALVGRPNVGKSTLFNRLTGSRAALVADLPGVTRDRHYGVGKTRDRHYWVVDTGGWGHPEDGLAHAVAEQIWRAVEEAAVVVLLVDARQGMTAADQELAERLRRSGKPVVLAVNKVDGLEPTAAAAEFHALGLGVAHPITAAHGQGVFALMGAVMVFLPEDAPLVDGVEHGIRVAVVGRPNVGKSTLVNRLLGETRMVTGDEPGTTRDAVEVPFTRMGRPYTLIDTAGLRRRSRVREVVERFSVLKTLQAIERAQVVILLLDARQGIGEQDATLLGWVVERGKALVIAVNKWDGLGADERSQVRRESERRLSFVDFAPVHFISALHGSGVRDLMESVEAAHASAMRKLSTPELTRMLRQAVTRHAPPAVHGRRIKLRYAHQGGHNPPLIVVHGNQTEALPDAYRRYLAGFFRRELALAGTPVHLEFRTGANPFEGRKNILTPRQVRRRKRLLRHVT